MPQRPLPRGCPSLWLLSLGQARESDRPPGMADEPHTDVSRVSRQRRRSNEEKEKPKPNQHQPPPTPPLKGRAKTKAERARSAPFTPASETSSPAASQPSAANADRAPPFVDRAARLPATTTAGA